MTQVIVNYDNISGIFRDIDAQFVIQELERRGIASENISCLVSESTGNSLIKMHGSNKAPEGATIGGVSGGILGAVIGGLTLVGSVLAPGLGVLAVGPAVGAITGAAAGVGAGGIIGGLIGMGVPEHEARYYEDALKEPGNLLVVVHSPKALTPEIKALFERYNVKNLAVQS